MIGIYSKCSKPQCSRRPALRTVGVSDLRRSLLATPGVQDPSVWSPGQSSPPHPALALTRLCPYMCTSGASRGPSSLPETVPSHPGLSHSPLPASHALCSRPSPPQALSLLLPSPRLAARPPLPSERVNGLQCRRGRPSSRRHPSG